MSSLIPFQFDSHSIRVLMDNQGTAWFIAHDVAQALGYAKPRNAVAMHCKHAKSLKDMDALIQGVQQNQHVRDLDPKTKLISEGDVYRLTAQSKLPSAQCFEIWIFDQVLPSIRKTGRYEQPGQSGQLDNNSQLVTAIVELTAALRDSTKQLATGNLPQPSRAVSKKPPFALPFLNAWWDCLGARDVTAADLCRIIAGYQCPVLTATAID